ncbi:hypothetical protein [Cyanobium sp. ATX 6F1]|uniref:hypothetical protein n=1 Tax=Cyanobium sp. ATX 6F1 TaxID=2823702 RepID=UPI0020CC4DC1|nr:hypothetical protein [Cyanobium sp. ATX 6F1]
MALASKLARPRSPARVRELTSTSMSDSDRFRLQDWSAVPPALRVKVALAPRAIEASREPATVIGLPSPRVRSRESVTV